jgi:hypothetical protein
MKDLPLDYSKVEEWTKYIGTHSDDSEEMVHMYQEARKYLEFYDWCSEICESYVGILYLGIVAVFLFKITPARKVVDEWIWVIVGDIPPAYITTDECQNPATALDGYVGAMLEWVDAARDGRSVAKLIPVNVPATKENGDMLKIRLDFINTRILKGYHEDLKV